MNEKKSKRQKSKRIFLLFSLLLLTGCICWFCKKPPELLQPVPQLDSKIAKNALDTIYLSYKEDWHRIKKEYPDDYSKLQFGYLGKIGGQPKQACLIGSKLAKANFNYKGNKFPDGDVLAPYKNKLYFYNISASTNDFIVVAFPAGAENSRTNEFVEIMAISSKSQRLKPITLKVNNGDFISHKADKLINQKLGE